MNPQKSIGRRRRRLDGMKVFLVVFINYFIPALPGVTDRYNALIYCRCQASRASSGKLQERIGARRRAVSVRLYAWVQRCCRKGEEAKARTEINRGTKKPRCREEDRGIGSEQERRKGVKG